MRQKPTKPSAPMNQFKYWNGSLEDSPKARDARMALKRIELKKKKKA